MAMTDGAALLLRSTPNTLQGSSTPLEKTMLLVVAAAWGVEGGGAGGEV